MGNTKHLLSWGSYFDGEPRQYTVFKKLLTACLRLICADDNNNYGVKDGLKAFAEEKTPVKSEQDGQQGGQSSHRDIEVVGMEMIQEGSQWQEGDFIWVASIRSFSLSEVGNSPMSFLQKIN